MVVVSETVASLLGQTSTWQGDSQGKWPDFPSESSVCSHPLSMTHPHPLSMTHFPGPMTGLGIRLPNNDATVSRFQSLSGAERSDRTLTLSFVRCLPLTDHSTIDFYCIALLSKVP